MASSLFTLLDDIATLLDDVAAMTKVATKRTAGVLGDDLAVNAEQVTGVRPDRELPVVWAVAKGSALNKAILVPAALLISAVAPWLIVPLLLLGGAFLCFEGCEKIAHRYLHPKESEAARHAELASAVADPSVDLVALEKGKIRGAVRTDFILSAEIVVIALGSAADAPLLNKALLLVAISVICTVGVYGLVAGIVKLDDAGVLLSRRESPIARGVGQVLLKVAPKLMKLLSVVGTVAMFLVGGGIVSHNVPAVHKMSVSLTNKAAASLGTVGEALTPLLFDAVLGILLGSIGLLGVTVVTRALKKRAPAEA
ncbi:MAG: DUF808 domain-containing protein [Polyangiaceae bacterium]|nr:DUF808 domain-containing protein [Polyangiaceae bacterium]MCW5789703.1 DUF808 domain-containing protein [Polyangiaceae bacterium]